MRASKRLEKDLALVREIIGVDPLDFARRSGGELVIILPDGRKLVLAPEQVDDAVRSGKYRARTGAVPSDAGSVGIPLPPARADAPPAPVKRRRGRPPKKKSSQ